MQAGAPVGYLSVHGAHTHHSHSEVHSYGNGDPGGHKTLDIGAVGKKAVHQFAHGIGPVQAGAYYAKLSGRQQARVNERLLHHTHGQAAYIVQCIAQRGGYERLHPVVLVFLLKIIHRYLSE